MKASSNMDTKEKIAKDLERKLDAAESMLARVGRECDIACIPTTDGDIPALRITYCEGHRVKLLRLKYEDTKRSLNAANEKYADACDTIVNLRLEIAELKGVNAMPNVRISDADNKI